MKRFNLRVESSTTFKLRIITEISLFVSRGITDEIKFLFLRVQCDYLFFEGSM